MPYDAGFIANCCICDSYFMLVARQFDMKQYKGKKGTSIMEDEIEELQLSHEKEPHQDLVCPFCSRLTTGKTWEELTCDKDADLAFTPCKFVSFEETGEDMPVNHLLSKLISVFRVMLTVTLQ